MSCSNTNRFQLPGSPSTCAIDSSLVPLPSILFLVFLAFYAIYFVVVLRRATPSPGSVRPSYAYTTPGLPIDRRDRTAPDGSLHVPYGPPVITQGRFGLSFWTRVEKITHYVYIALVSCLLGLRILEVIRLEAAEMGVGLLPFGLVVSIFTIFSIAAGEKLGMGRTRGVVYSSVLLSYWVFSLVMESVKVGRLSTYNQVHPAKGTDYPSSDWLLDNACMLGLLIAFFLIEGAYLTSLVRLSVISSTQSQLPRLKVTDAEAHRTDAQTPYTYNGPSSHPSNYRVNVGHARNTSGSTFSLSSQDHSQTQIHPGSPRSWTFKDTPKIDKSSISKPGPLVSSTMGIGQL